MRERTIFSDKFLRQNSFSSFGKTTNASLSATNSENLHIYARVNVAAPNETFTIEVREGGPTLMEFILNPLNRKTVIFVAALFVLFVTSCSCFCCYTFKKCCFKPKPLPDLDLTAKSRNGKKDPDQT